MWERFATRALFAASYGGADFGECQATMARIGDDGDADAWYREWVACGDALAQAGAASEAAGHDVGAHDAYVRAAGYYRTSLSPLFGAPVDPRLPPPLDKSPQALAAGGGGARPPGRPGRVPV